MTIDLTPILQAFIALLAGIITYKVIPYIKSKVTEQQYSNLTTAAEVAVFAAEQIFAHGDNDKKLDYVLENLKKAGFDLDKEALRTAVEKAVYELKEEQNVIGFRVAKNDIDDSTKGNKGSEDEGDFPFPELLR